MENTLRVFQGPMWTTLRGILSEFKIARAVRCKPEIGVVWKRSEMVDGSGRRKDP
jgi:hypothetical protein